MARHQPDESQRKAVTVMVGLGAPPQIIADGLNIELETLERVYAKEIENGPASVRLELTKQLFNAARTDEGAGRVSAAVKLLDLLAGDDQVAADAKTIRITGEERMIHVIAKSPENFTDELFDREGRKISFVWMLPGDERP
jgi:hypothetical protein